MKSAVTLMLLATATALEHCPDSWSAFEGECYAVSSFAGPWTSATDLCDYMHPGALPASVHKLETNGHLSSLLEGQKAWIGLGRQGGSDFQWSDNSTVDFLYWGAGQPGDDDCAIINRNSVTGQWGSVDCSALHLAVCQVDAQPGPEPGSCPDGWSEFNGACYWHSGNENNVPWSSIVHECSTQQPGAEPVSIHDDETNAFLHSLMSGMYTWIGLWRDEYYPDNWLWVDASEVDYTNWRSGEPSDTEYNCAEMLSDATWESYYCYDSDRPFFCQLKL